MTQNPYAHLPDEWQHWVDENLARGVTTGQIDQILQENGFITHHATNTKLPYIRHETNQLLLDDHACQLIFVAKSPFVAIIDNFLSPDECQGLIDFADSKFIDARVVDDATGDFVLHQNRTSMNASFGRGETPLIAKIEQRIANLLHWEVEKGEPIQVLRYEIGGEYKAHYDYFDPTSVGGQKNMTNSGQRVGTFLMYLSDVEAGGATAFPKLGFEVRPKAGTALYFANVSPAGEIDPNSLHSSVPVVHGTKYLATKWLRINPYV